jgi:nicotinamidase/pyrazinamidase
VSDALRLGYATFLLLDAVRAVEVNAGDGERAIAEMRRLGATVIDFTAIAA